MNTFTASPKRDFLWGNIASGVVATLSIAFLLSILGVSLGFSIIDPLSDDIINGAGTTVLLWSGFAIILSLAIGSYISGYLARVNGAIHGLIVWAASIALVLILVIMAAIGLVKTTANAVGSVVASTGSVVSGASGAIGDGIKGFADIGQELMGDIDIDTDIEPTQLKGEVLQALQKSGIETFQPGFLKNQLEEAKSDISYAIKKIVTDPDSLDQVMKELSDKLKDLSIRTTDDLDRNKIEVALTKNTSLSKEEVHDVTENILSAHDKLSSLLNKNITDVQNQIEMAKEKYQNLKEIAKQKAAEAADALSKTALWGFISLTLALVICMFSGVLGANISSRIKNSLL